MSDEFAYIYDALKKQVKKRIDMDEVELQMFCAAFQVASVKKRQFLVQPNFQAKHRYYVFEGAFRAYVVDDEGEEHTIQFAIDDWWITDYQSYILQEPASMFIVALTDGLVLKIDYHAEQALKLGNHRYETFFRILAEHTAAYMYRRVVVGLTQNAEERFENFLDRYPKVVQKVPQYALASFLGMTTEYLSKLRKKRIGSKN